MGDNFEELLGVIQDDTKAGKQARQNLGLIFLFRLQQNMNEADEMLLSNNLNDLPFAFSRYDAVYRKIKSMLTEKEKDILDKLRDDLKKDVFLLKQRTANVERARHKGRSVPLIAPESLIPNLEDYDMALNEALNAHNLNTPIRTPETKSMDEE